MKKISVFFMSILMAGCAMKPPAPPACIDDGRGLYPINPTRMTPEELQNGIKKEKNLNKAQTESLNV